MNFGRHAARIGQVVLISLHFAAYQNVAAICALDGNPTIHSAVDVQLANGRHRDFADFAVVAALTPMVALFVAVHGFFLRQRSRRQAQGQNQNPVHSLLPFP